MSHLRVKLIYPENLLYKYRDHLLLIYVNEFKFKYVCVCMCFLFSWFSFGIMTKYMLKLRWPQRTYLLHLGTLMGLATS